MCGEGNQEAMGNNSTADVNTFTQTGKRFKWNFWNNYRSCRQHFYQRMLRLLMVINIVLHTLTGEAGAGALVLDGGRSGYLNNVAGITKTKTGFKWN